MIRRSIGILAATSSLLLSLLLSVPLSAAGSQIWEASQTSDLSAGTLDGTVLDAEGRIALAQKRSDLWGPEEGIVWAVDDDGDDAVFVALSGPGRLLRVTAAGAELWFDAGEEGLITSVAADGKGGVYLGLVPDGSVLHLKGPQAIAREYKTGARFIWDLERGEDGSLWVATGTPGTIQRSRNAEDLETLFEAGEDPVRTLMAVGDAVLAGTGGRGRVLRLDRQGKAFVLHDADEPEIVGLAEGAEGVVFALAVEGSKQVASQGKAPPPDQRSSGNYVAVTAEAPPANGGEEQKPAPKPEPQPRPKQRLKATAGGAVYRIEPDGAVHRIWSAGAAMPFAIARGADGRLLISTGDAGLLLSMDDDGESYRVQRIASSQASALAATPGGAVFVGGTSDARITKLEPGRRERGSYLTPAIDAGAPARWGRIGWQGSNLDRKRIGVNVRYGNSEEPDETWSDWEAAEERDGAAFADVPHARWLQVRFDLQAAKKSDPTISALEVAYSPINRAPEISQVQVQPSGIVYSLQRPSTQSTGGPFVADDPVSRQVADALQGNRSAGALRRYYEPGMRTVTWSAVDPDSDRLTYELQLRLESSEEWIPLARELTDAFHSWDARAMPDGRYRLRLIAHDSSDRAADRKSQSRISDSFRIDHTRPTVTAWEVARDGYGELEVHDPDGRIESVEYAWDDGDWRPATPIDGVADSERERFRIPLGDGTAAVRIRVTDAEGNVAGTIRSL